MPPEDKQEGRSPTTSTLQGKPGGCHCTTTSSKGKAEGGCPATTPLQDKWRGHHTSTLFLQNKLGAYHLTSTVRGNSIGILDWICMKDPLSQYDNFFSPPFWFKSSWEHELNSLSCTNHVVLSNKYNGQPVGMFMHCNLHWLWLLAIVCIFFTCPLKFNYDRSGLANLAKNSFPSHLKF